MSSNDVYIRAQITQYSSSKVDRQLIVYFIIKIIKHTH
jgi:ABC-type uncharacterized transport system substrate-binding protein